MQSSTTYDNGFFTKATNRSYYSMTLRKNKVQYGEKSNKVVMNKNRTLYNDNQTFSEQRLNKNSMCHQSVSKNQLFTKKLRDNCYKADEQSYSLKFPNGMPFEQEFYHKNCENSISLKSILSDNSTSENDGDRLSLSFEEKNSTEAIYINYKSPECSNYYLKPTNNQIGSSSQPVVYIAVEWYSIQNNFQNNSDKKIIDVV